MDKKPKIRFTNEMLVKKFKSVFDLVNYSILLAENMIKTGRDARVKSDVQNRAMLILEEISEGKDHIDEIEIKEIAPSSKGTFQSHRSQPKFSEEEALEHLKSRQSDGRRKY